MTSDPRTLRISNMGNSASPLGSLDYSRRCHVTFGGSESSVNLDASCRYPTILLRITHYLQEVVRRLGLNPLGEKLQELLFCASAIDSSQCCGDHGPRGENVLCRRVLTETRAVGKLDILHTKVGGGVRRRLQWIHAAGRRSSSRTGGCAG